MNEKLTEKEFSLLLEALDSHVDEEELVFSGASLIGLLMCDEDNHKRELAESIVEAKDVIEKRKARLQLEVMRLKIKLLEMKDSLVEKSEKVTED